MKRLAGLLLLLACAAACGYGLYISSVNRETVVLDLLFWPQLQLRAGLVVVLAFVAGALAGLLAGWLAGAAGKSGSRRS
ncbi:MAG: lipopolysaccharide assembly protein LapA domain-containing protein [Pseudomonadota bacterium]